MKTILLTLLALTTFLHAQNQIDITFTLEIQPTNDTPITHEQITQTTNPAKAQKPPTQASCKS